MDQWLEIVIILSIALVMSGLNFLSHWVSDHLVKFRFQILSFSAGLLVSILFLVIAEEVFAHPHGSMETHGHFFDSLVLFGGFLLIHIVERILFKYIKKKEELERDLKELHLVGLFIDHFFLGIILVTSVTFDNIASFIILIPLFLESIASTISITHIDECTVKQTKLGKIISLLAPLIGAGTALLIGINDILTLYLSAFALGAVLYIAVRDVIPKKKGKLLWFLIGTSITITVSLIKYFSYT